MRPDPIVLSLLIVSLVQLSIVLMAIFGWLDFAASPLGDALAAMLSFALPLCGALLARHILRRQQDAAEDAKRYDL